MQVKWGKCVERDAHEVIVHSVLSNAHERNYFSVLVFVGK